MGKAFYFFWKFENISTRISGGAPLTSVKKTKNLQNILHKTDQKLS
jgi:hypothetical protein